MAFHLEENPCKQTCEERSSTCHGTCERYAKYAKNREEYREFVRAQKASDRDFRGYMNEQSRKVKRELRHSRRNSKW